MGEMVDQEHGEKGNVPNNIFFQMLSRCFPCFFFHPKMDETLSEIPDEETTVVQELPISHLLICDRDEENNDCHTFYNVSEHECEIWSLPELQNKKVSCCYREWLVLMDKSTHDCSILNSMTMEKSQLPSLDISEHHRCVVLPKMGVGLRIFFFEGRLSKARSCHLGDSKFVGHNLDLGDAVLTATTVNGKMYVFTFSYHLAVADLSSENLDFKMLIKGESVEKSLSTVGNRGFYLVESCGELLFVFINWWSDKVVDVKIFMADFDNREWERVYGLGDQAIFLDELYGYSSPALTNGLKPNCIYLVNNGNQNLYVYNIEDQSIATSVPSPVVYSRSQMFWMSGLRN